MLPPPTQPSWPRQLRTAAASADGQVLDAFFRDGITRLGAAQFLDALTGWTTTTVHALAEPTQLMAQFLACLEDSDRRSGVIDDNWADLWRRLGRAGEPPRWQELASELVAAAVIQSDQRPGHGHGDEPAILYRIHPGVAQAIDTATDSVIKTATDTELAAFWTAVARQAIEQEGSGHGQIVVTAGLSATPYLLRLHDWNGISWLLGQVLTRDRSPGTIQAIVPSLRAVADATGAPDDLRVLARALRSVDPAEAERLLRAALDQTVAGEDFESASIAAADLFNLLQITGRLREALDLTGPMADYTRRAGLGPWSLLSTEGQRLQILALMGEHRQVLERDQPRTSPHE